MLRFVSTVGSPWATRNLQTLTLFAPLLVLTGILGFAFPLAGIAIGAAAGAVVGRIADTGVSDSFVDEVKGTLRPGRSALFLVVKQSESDATIAALRDFRGEVLQTTLSSEAEQAFRDSLSKR